MTDINQRYLNQNSEYDQEKFKNAKVTVVGAGPLANHICAYLAGFGMGGIKVIDEERIESKDAKEFLYEKEDVGQDKGEVMIRKLKKINEDINARHLKSQVDPALIGRCDILVDATNNPTSKKRCRQYADDLNSRGEADIRAVISASSDDFSSSIAIYRPARKLNDKDKIKMLFMERKNNDAQRIAALFGAKTIDDFLLPEFEGSKQGTFSSSIIGAMCVDEVRKILHPFETIRDYPLETRVTYDLLSAKRFTAGGPKRDDPRLVRLVSGQDIRNPEINPQMFSDKKVLVVGVGGVGTYTVLNLATLGFGVTDIYDGDTIEEHNRPRQIFYYGAENKNKAEILADRLSKVNPNSKIVPHGVYIDNKNISKLGKYDLVFDCTDKKEPKIILSKFCVDKNTPLFSGGVSLYTARSECFIPGKNRCYGCRSGFDIPNAASEERRGGCQQNVIAPNVLVAGFNVGEGITLMFPGYYMVVPDKKIEFTSRIGDARKIITMPINYASEDGCRMKCYRHK